MDQKELPVAQQQELNAVLDAALDALDDDDDDEEHQEEEEEVGSPKEQQDSPHPMDGPKPIDPNPSAFGPERPPDFDLGRFDDMMKHMLQGGDDCNPEAALDSFMNQLQTQFESDFRENVTAPTQEPGINGDENGAQQAHVSSPLSDPSSSDDVDRTISKLLNDMANSDVHNDMQVPSGDPPFHEETVFQEMMKEFGNMGTGLGGAVDEDAVVEGMMQQLLSKDIMYEPMKQVADRFPSWLEENKEELSEEEYCSRSQQYECFQKLIEVYESDPEDVKMLMELMQDVQEFGQPPPEIIKEIAPGLDLDEEGVPKLSGLPFGENEECSIM